MVSFSGWRMGSRSVLLFSRQLSLPMWLRYDTAWTQEPSSAGTVVRFY